MLRGGRGDAVVAGVAAGGLAPLDTEHRRPPEGGAAGAGEAIGGGWAREGGVGDTRNGEDRAGGGVLGAVPRHHGEDDARYLYRDGPAADLPNGQEHGGHQ